MMSFPLKTLAYSFAAIIFGLASLHADEDALRKSLVFHASFDSSMDADYSTADAAVVKRTSKGFEALEETEPVVLAPSEGKWGGALWFPKKGTVRPTYRGDGMLGYNDKDWNATVSLWIRLTPDEDLEPGYCDPIQIVGDNSKKGFLFLEWSKDHTPRYFRYAIRPIIELWNPDELQWEKVPYERRPMVELKKTSFSRDKWTHAVFTIEHLNREKGVSAGALYLDGELKGRIDGHDLRFDWDKSKTALVLGSAYVGYLDDVSVFNRVLSAEEISVLHALKGGVSDLRK